MNKIKIDNFRIKDFKRYCKDNFGIDEVFSQIADRRKRPQIKPQHLMWAITNMVPLGVKSILELDQIGRLSQMRKYIGTKRYMVASDTTYDRVLSLMSAGGIRKAMAKIYQKIRQDNLDRIRLESERQLCIAGIDACRFRQTPVVCVVYIRQDKDNPRRRAISYKRQRASFKL